MHDASQLLLGLSWIHILPKVVAIVAATARSPEPTDERVTPGAWQGRLTDRLGAVVRTSVNRVRTDQGKEGAEFELCGVRVMLRVANDPRATLALLNAIHVD